MEIIAHRGAPCGTSFGNTIESFDKAIKKGATGFECDVVLTKDNEPVIIHPKRYNSHKLAKPLKGIDLSKTTFEDLKKLNFPKGIEQVVLGENFMRLFQKTTNQKHLKNQVQECKNKEIQVMMGYADTKDSLKWAESIGLSGVFTNKVEVAYNVINKKLHIEF